MSEERIERLTFHLKTGDYFPMLATILGFAQETVAGCECGADGDLVPLETGVLKNTRNELLFQNYSNYVLNSPIP
jgi:hypothetical protein